MQKKILMLILVSIFATGCSNQRLSVGSVVGGATGAMVGGMFGLLASGGGISKNADSLALGGVIIGGVIGASAGGGIQSAIEK